MQLSTTTIISCLIACLCYFEGVPLFVVASTSSTFLGGGGKSIVGGATKPSKHESILQHLDQETSSRTSATGDDVDDDEVIYVRKRDGSRELLDGNKVRAIVSSVVSKEELFPEGLSHFYSLTQMFLLVSDWSTARDADL